MAGTPTAGHANADRCMGPRLRGDDVLPAGGLIGIIAHLADPENAKS